MVFRQVIIPVHDQLRPAKTCYHIAKQTSLRPRFKSPRMHFTPRPLQPPSKLTETIQGCSIIRSFPVHRRHRYTCQYNEFCEIGSQNRVHIVPVVTRAGPGPSVGGERIAGIGAVERSARQLPVWSFQHNSNKHFNCPTLELTLPPTHTHEHCVN